LTVGARAGIIGPAMRLVLSLACEEARPRPDGRLDFLGVFDELQAPGFPAVQDRMTVVFIMAWDPTEEGRHAFRADLLDEADRKVLTIEGHTDVAPRGHGARPRTQLIMPLERVVFPRAGDYRFILHAAGSAVTALVLRLSEQAGRQPAGRTPSSPRG
jgi:hypothetical protein